MINHIKINGDTLMTTSLKLLLIYIIVINVVAFLLMGIDKLKAKKHKWRIPEATLFISSIAGGSIGALLGMYTFRHKTKHLTFVIGMPVILVCHIALVLFFYFSDFNFIFM